MDTILTFATVALLSTSATLSSSAQPFCQFSVPSNSQQLDNGCSSFDLSGVAHMSAFNISADGTLGWKGGDTYLLTICDNVKGNVPIACYGASPSPAYFFNTNGHCNSLGKLEDFSVVRGTCI